MKARQITLLFITLISLFSFQPSAQKVNQPIQLEALLEQYSKEYYALNPLQATEAGINDYNNQMEITISESYIKKAKAFNQKYLNQLAVISKAGLTASQLLSIDVLTYKLKSENELLNNSLISSTNIYRPVDQFVWSFPTRFASLGSGAGFVPFNTEKDYRDFIKQRKILLHQRMMISSFICAAYFVTVRVIDDFAMGIFNALFSNESAVLLASDVFVWLVPLLLFWIYWMTKDKKQIA